MNKLFLAFAVLWTLGCKKPQPKMAEKSEAAAAAPAEAPITAHVDLGNAAAPIDAAHRAADKLQAAENKEKDAMEQMGK